MRYLIFVFMLTSLFGCYNAELTEPTEKPMLYLDRDDFITKTTLSNRSIRFSELDSETQKLFWIDKLDQVRSLAVSEKQDQLVLSAIKFLSSKAEFSDLEQPLLDIGYDLALVSSENFYKLAFMSLLDVSGSDLESTVGSYASHAHDIRNGIGYFHLQAKDNSDEGNEKPSCNCNWSCDAVETIDPCIESEKGCEPTARGCGFLGFGGCYRRLTDKCIPE